jgi:hypothetical protein
MDEIVARPPKIKLSLQNQGISKNDMCLTLRGHPK